MGFIHSNSLILSQWRSFTLWLSHWWSAFMNVVNWISDLLLVSLSDLLNSSFAVQSLSNGLVGLHELVQLLGQLFVLDGDYPNVIVQRIDFNLKVRIVVKKCGIAISGSLEFFSHVHDLILLGSDLGLEILDGSSEFHVSWALSVNSLLKVSILVSVLFFKTLEVV